MRATRLCPLESLSFLFASTAESEACSGAMDLRDPLAVKELDLDSRSSFGSFMLEETMMVVTLRKLLRR